MAQIRLQPLPPKEAIEFFRQKGYAVGFDHRDVWQEQHQAAFTVAKVMQLDLLQDIRAEIDRALANGTTLQTFQRELEPSLKARGWWGRRLIQDPQTGEMVEAQLGSPRRLKVIYDTNLRTAHSEGQWQRIQDNKTAFPFLEYDGRNSEHPRLDHSAWDGLVLPVDDPFWLSHFPVKAYGCKCRGIPRTARQLERNGRKVGTAPNVPVVPYLNKRTGEVQEIPAGVDPSFHYRPGGRRAALAQHLVDKLEAAPAELAKASVADLVAGKTFATWYAKPAGSFPLAYLPRKTAERLGARTQLLALSEETLAKQLLDHPEVTLDDYSGVQAVLDQGREFIDDDGSVTYVLDHGKGDVSIVRATKKGQTVLVTSVRRLSRDAAKRDQALQKLLLK